MRVVWQVFITVPIVEVSFMRHTTESQREVSQVLKLVCFQVLATLSTIGSFLGDSFLGVDWYITGGFLLVNGMFVDLFVISCVIQGWGLNLRLGRLVFAPASLTQMEMDRFYAGDGAKMYVVDRLQMVTKFVVMCYITSAAIPLLHWVVLLVLSISIFIDETNLLRVLHPAPQSNEAVVKCILVFVMPLAVLFHLFAAYLFFSQLGVVSLGFGSLLNTTLPGFGSMTDDGLTFVQWSVWINLPLTLFFIAREWPKSFGWWHQAPDVHLQALSFVGRTLAKGSEAIGGAANNLATVAGSALRVPSTQLTSALGEEISTGIEEAKNFAGNVVSSVSSTLKLTPRQLQEGSNEALAVKYLELVAIYTKAGREAELLYAPPDTSALLMKCLEGVGVGGPEPEIAI